MLLAMMTMTFFQTMLLGVLLLTSAGCCSGLHVRPVDVPAAALEKAVAVAEDVPMLSRGSAIPQSWWHLFGDAQLDAFIEKTLQQNPTLQSAQMRILAAAYMAETLQSALYPYISLGADVSRQKLSRTGVIPFNTGPKGSDTPVISVPAMPGSASQIPEYFTLYETELNLTYHFDFWHKHRNTYIAALGHLQAQIAEEAFARLELSIRVAEVYYQLQMNYKRQDILQAFVDNRTSYVELIQKRLEGNLDNELALQAAESNLSDAKDLLLRIQGTIALNENQLRAYMAGDFQEEIFARPIHPCGWPKVPMPENLPMHLLAQRPDITAQLWVIESAGRQIDVAKAGFYPDFNLAAFFGFQTIHFAKLFSWPSTFFNVDPAVTLPIFDAGRLMANLRGAEIDYDLEILEYNRLVIGAVKEVLDGLALLRNTWQRLQESESKLSRQHELYRLTKLRVAHSLNSNLDELISEGNVLMSRDQEIIALEHTIQAVLGLIKSLGGGYEVCEECPP